jgi:hypothetical protein
MTPLGSLARTYPRSGLPIREKLFILRLLSIAPYPDCSQPRRLPNENRDGSMVTDFRGSEDVVILGQPLASKNPYSISVSE